MNRLVLFAPLVLFGLGGIFLFAQLMRHGAPGTFEDNLIPELIGFCLEGFFLVGIFSLIQLRLARERKNELRLSLRGALREVLSHLDVALLEEFTEPATSAALEQDPRAVQALFVKLSNRQLELEDMRNLKKTAGVSFSILRDLIPVAANLSADHMRWWLAIADSVREIAEATSSIGVTTAAQRFLINVGEFDDLRL
ncbi:hypothetical protein C0039_06315 [Pseudohalioglobus lutimaris]|uniref:Uncharacterized protein n=2 Tax=Pseudohalioglobus lutimaris TaxID=1737061 RepID=A0A2N5X561_9GAMM|nr:hypothetical protein C0039_06315 [Pseudohalioglobus lutimaris]